MITIIRDNARVFNGKSEIANKSESQAVATLARVIRTKRPQVIGLLHTSGYDVPADISMPNLVRATVDGIYGGNEDFVQGLDNLGSNGRYSSFAWIGAIFGMVGQKKEKAAEKEALSAQVTTQILAGNQAAIKAEQNQKNAFYAMMFGLLVVVLYFVFRPKK